MEFSHYRTILTATVVSSLVTAGVLSVAFSHMVPRPILTIPPFVPASRMPSDPSLKPPTNDKDDAAAVAEEKKEKLKAVLKRASAHIKTEPDEGKKYKTVEQFW